MSSGPGLLPLKVLSEKPGFSLHLLQEAHPDFLLPSPQTGLCITGSLSEVLRAADP